MSVMDTPAVLAPTVVELSPELAAWGTSSGCERLSAAAKLVVAAVTAGFTSISLSAP